MNYTTVERDFVERSLEILRQYDEYVIPNSPPDKEHEVTLLLNCLLGLIVVPFEHLKRAQSTRKCREGPRFPVVCAVDETPISELQPEWGLARLEIGRFVNYDGKTVDRDEATLRQVVAMFRHSMAHGRFGDGAARSTPLGLSVRYDASPSNPIESVIIEVNFVNQHNKTDFKAMIPVDDLRKFATTFAETFLREFRVKASAG